MREIVLDTETTGLDPKEGHRLVELGCIELINHLSTGETYQQYIDPKRNMPTAAFEIHGLTETFLSEFPVFSEIVDGFLDFIGGDTLIIHNAAFDIGFINAELKIAGKPNIEMSQTIDTVSIARRLFPGAPASLDALCRRYGIDNSTRTKHGALLDAELLADVYLELQGGREPGLTFAPKHNGPATELDQKSAMGEVEITTRRARPHTASPEERAAHTTFIETLKDPLWNNLKRND